MVILFKLKFKQNLKLIQIVKAERGNKSDRM